MNATAHPCRPRRWRCRHMLLAASAFVGCAMVLVRKSKAVDTNRPLMSAMTAEASVDAGSGSAGE